MNRRNPWIAWAVAVALVLVAPLGAQAENPFPITPEYYDKNLNSEDSTWPDDPAVPAMPPVPGTDDPKPPADNWLAQRYWDGLHTPKVGPQAPLTDVVSDTNPLKADVIWSMRSPYSYLALQRLVWLHSNYNVDITIRPVLPVAVRSTKGGAGKAGGVFALWYKLPFTMWDTVRTGQFHGVPFKWASPDPIWQNIWPASPDNKQYEYVHPPEKQPYIVWITRLGCYAMLQGKSIDYVAAVSPLIWGDQVDHWPAHVKDAFNGIEGLDYDTAIEFIQNKPDEVDACWQNNAVIQATAGHGGVPLMIFEGEPFFGQDRVEEFVWRLRQSGLTERSKPIAPFVTKPLRWPAGL